MATIWIDWTKFSSIVARAAREGAPMTATRAVWDISMGCDKPYDVMLGSQKPKDAFSDRVTVEYPNVRWIDVRTSCRKCGPCLRNRQILWKRRMKVEVQRAPRTWMATFTVNPHYRFVFSVRSRSRDYINSYREIRKELTKYFKRLRKAGYRFRYVIVAEAHKDGYPHLHGLIHEVFAPIPKRALQAEWPYGFTTFKLVENKEKAINYVSKYIVKDTRTRIAASLRYGQSDRSPDILSLEDILKL